MGDPHDYAAAAQTRTREAERRANASVQQAEVEASRYWNDPHAAPELTWWERWGWRDPRRPDCGCNSVDLHQCRRSWLCLRRRVSPGLDGRGAISGGARCASPHIPKRRISFGHKRFNQFLSMVGAQPPSVGAGSSADCSLSGSAFGAVWVLLVLDILLDDVQWCAAGGDDGVGR